MKKNETENQGNGIMDKMEQILKKIEDERTVSLEELKSAGFILAANKSFGRVINKTHLKELKCSLKKYGCIEPKFPRLSLLRTDFTGYRHISNFFQRMKPINTP